MAASTNTSGSFLKRFKGSLFYTRPHFPNRKDYEEAFDDDLKTTIT